MDFEEDLGADLAKCQGQNCSPNAFFEQTILVLGFVLRIQRLNRIVWMELTGMKWLYCNGPTRSTQRRVGG